jgi:hypothetical protein
LFWNALAVRHYQIIIANARGCQSKRRALYGYVLAYHIAIAYFHCAVKGAAVAYFAIAADNSIGTYYIVFAHRYAWVNNGGRVYAVAWIKPGVLIVKVKWWHFFVLSVLLNRQTT